MARQTAVAQVVIAVPYFVSSFDEGMTRGGAQCQGFNTQRRHLRQEGPATGLASWRWAARSGACALLTVGAQRTK